MRRFPADAPEIDDVFLDLSHGVFVDPDAEAIWSAQYAASIRVDLAGLGRDSLNARRARWRDLLRARPDVVYSRLGPQLRCEVPGLPIRMLGEESPLSFDANTVPGGVLRLVPGLTEAANAAWLRERARQPFADAGDLARRVSGVRSVGARMRCGT